MNIGFDVPNTHRKEKIDTQMRELEERHHSQAELIVNDETVKT